MFISAALMAHRLSERQESEAMFAKRKDILENELIRIKLHLPIDRKVAEKISRELHFPFGALVVGEEVPVCTKGERRRLLVYYGNIARQNFLV